MNIEDVEINSKWYVQLAPGCALMEVEIVEKTELTIVMLDPHSHSKYNTSRYIFSDIKLVEAC